MSREVKIETYSLVPPYKIVEHIASYGDEQDRLRPVDADVTNWHLETDPKFKPLIDIIHENYPHIKLMNSGDVHIDRAIMLRLIIILGMLMLLFGLWLPILLLLR